MNLKEAYKILDLAEGSTPDEAKKKYRELSKVWHPDVSSDPQAEEKFKKINEAYECVKSGKGNDPIMQSSAGWSPFHRQQPQQVVHVENIEHHLTITFKESVLGCKKEVKYLRQTKCPDCRGSGEVHVHNGCAKCGGRGQVTIMQRGMIIVSTCSDCHGKVNSKECSVCQGEGTVQADVSVHVSVPAGILDGNTLRLQGMGNYAGSVMGVIEQYTDTLCHITVEEEPGLSIDGKNVVCTLTIPLLSALQGCMRTVKTINGTQKIVVPPNSRNREEVIIPHLGVGGTGDQKVILDVQYPNDISKLIGILTDEGI